MDTSVNCIQDQGWEAKLTLDTYGHILEEGHRLDREATLQKLEDASPRCYQDTNPTLKLEEGTKAETLDRTGAGDRTRTDDLRITSALPKESHRCRHASNAPREATSSHLPFSCNIDLRHIHGCNRIAVVLPGCHQIGGLVYRNAPSP